MHSRRGTPSPTWRLSAFPPPPPMPTTFIRAFCDTVSSSSKIMAPSGPRSEEVLQPSLERSEQPVHPGAPARDRKSTRLNSSHLVISYAVFCLKKKKKTGVIDLALSKTSSQDT